MVENRWQELPEPVVDKIEKVLGILSSELAQYDIAQLVEELCDTALMFDREARGGGRPQPLSEAPTPPGSDPEGGD